MPLINVRERGLSPSRWSAPNTLSSANKQWIINKLDAEGSVRTPKSTPGYATVYVHISFSAYTLESTVQFPIHTLWSCVKVWRPTCQRDSLWCVPDSLSLGPGNCWDESKHKTLSLILTEVERSPTGMCMRVRGVCACACVCVLDVAHCGSCIMQATYTPSHTMTMHTCTCTGTITSSPDGYLCEEQSLLSIHVALET